MYQQLQDRDRTTEIARSSPTPSLVQLRPAVEEYIRLVREDAIPRVGGFYQAIVGASNARRDEGRKQLACAKRNAACATRAALILYIVGSILALGRQYLDKVYSKKPGTAASPQSSTV